MDDSDKLGFIMSTLTIIVLILGGCGLYLTYQTHKEQSQQLAT